MKGNKGINFCFICAFCILFFIGSPKLHAQGFSDQYNVRIGDYNNDGLDDLYVSRRPEIILLHGDIVTPIVLPDPVESFVLQNAGDGEFDVISLLSSTEKAILRDWAQAGVDLFLKDINFDGFVDIEINGISDLISGANDLIVFADSILSSAPVHITFKNQKFLDFYSDLTLWMADVDYFDNFAAPIYEEELMTDGEYAPEYCGTADMSELEAQPPITVDVSARSEIDETNTEFIAWCTAWYGANVNIHWDFVTFRWPEDILVGYDYSGFDQDAVETADVFERLTADCPIALSDDDELVVEQAIDAVYGDSGIFDGEGLIDTLNQIPHETVGLGDAPGDSLFDSSDSTFHHYDVLTKICEIGEAGCTKSEIEINALRNFSYPSYKLQADLTSVDGIEEVLVRLAPPWATEDPEQYTIEGGWVTQSFLFGSWAGAIQNVTEPLHVVYPGTISRIVIEEEGALYVFTHGIGINRLGCSAGSLDDYYLVKGIQMIMGYSNDVWGYKAFKQLDKQMIEYWLP